MCHSRACEPTKLHCSTVQGKCISHCSVLHCKTGSQKVCVTAITPMELCSPYRCAVKQQRCSAALVCAKCICHCSVLLCKTGSQQVFVTAITPMEICSSYRCAVTQHKCSATLFRAKCNPHCSALLCKTGSQQAVWHCSYTYGDLLFTQVRSDSALMQCSFVQGKMQSPLFSAALQNRLTAGSVALQLHLWRFALHTGVQ